MDEEKWVAIPMADGYEVSNYGRVRSLYLFRRTRSGKPFKTPNPRILKPADNGHGYKYITIRKEGKRVGRFYIHRLVAELFLPNPNGYTQVNHKDEDKSNNCVDNLEWCDSQYNMDYSRSKTVAQIDMDTDKIVGVFKSAKEASRQLGISSGNITQACNGAWKYYNGYRWAYLDMARGFRE